MQDTINMGVLPPGEGCGPVPVRAAYAVQPAFDAVRYWSYLDAIEATEAEKHALLETLWTLMARFVELGFGVDPVQTVIPALIAASLDSDGNQTPVAGGFNRMAQPGKGDDHDD